jgi:hypothetical protein
LARFIFYEHKRRSIAFYSLNGMMLPDGRRPGIWSFPAIFESGGVFRQKAIVDRRTSVQGLQSSAVEDRNLA